jgi:hypothetical protein
MAEHYPDRPRQLDPMYLVELRNHCLSVGEPVSLREQHPLIRGIPAVRLCVPVFRGHDWEMCGAPHGEQMAFRGLHRKRSWIEDSVEAAAFTLDAGVMAAVGKTANAVNTAGRS